MAVQRAGVLFSALLLAAALQLSTVSAQKMASLTSATSVVSNSEDGSGFAANNLIITDGEGTSFTLASSEAFAVAQSEIVTIIKRVLSSFPAIPDPLVKSDFCPAVGEFIEVDAVAVGLAGASVTVEAVSDVVIDGEGSGCSNAGATGAAFAVAFADLVVDAIAVADIAGINTATARALLGAKSDAFASAFAAATADACLVGTGEAVADQIVTAEALAKPIASILVYLEAFVDCSGFSDVFVEAEVGASLEDVAVEVSQQGSSSVVGQGTAGTTADAGANTGRLCSGRFEQCCGFNLKEGDVCYCNRRNRPSIRVCEATKNVVAGGVFFKDGDETCGCA